LAKIPCIKGFSLQTSKQQPSLDHPSCSLISAKQRDEKEKRSNNTRHSDVSLQTFHGFIVSFDFK
jgi:hypothetical protein